MSQEATGKVVGQCTMEYVFLIAVVVAALIAMHAYCRRAMQANLKSLETELNAITEAKCREVTWACCGSRSGPVRR